MSQAEKWQNTSQSASKVTSFMIENASFVQLSPEAIVLVKKWVTMQAPDCFIRSCDTRFKKNPVQFR